MQDAQLVLCNGNVVTFDRSSRIASSLAIANGRVVAVGSDEEVARKAPPGVKTIDLGGRTAMPGFFDGHPHMDREGLKACAGVPISGLRSIDQIVAVVEGAVKKAAPGEWIVLTPLGNPPLGYINDPAQLTEGRFPTRHDLDVVSPDNPVFIRSVWGWWSTPPFPSVANSAALRTMGVTAQTRAPRNVTIVKDAQGLPTGVFLERNRTPILEYTLCRKVPRFTYEDRVKSAEIGSQLYSALGTTAGYEGHGLTPALIRAYNQASCEGKLSVRLVAPVSVPSPAKSVTDIKDLMYHWSAFASGKGSGSGRFRANGVMLDLGDREVASTIAAEYPYEQWAGFFYQGLTDAEFVELGVHAVRLGLRLNCITTEAPPVYSLERSLRLLEAVNDQVSIRDLRCVGIHLMGGTDDQLRRFRDLGLAATVTPSLLHNHAKAFSLEGRSDDAMPIRRMLDLGIPVALSTDNVPPSMLFAAWNALSRWDAVNQCAIGQSYLSREEALRLCTQTGHYLNWDEGHRGAIAEGYAADIVVLDGDPLTCPLEMLPHLPIDLTVVDGEIRYERARPT
jgi:predicted amidohydrolase YtcJ